MKITGLTSISSMLILMSGVAVAQQETAADRHVANEPATECLNELDRVTQRYDEAQLSDAARREVRQLRESAKSLGQRGNEEACDSIVKTISDIADEDQSRAEERAQEAESMRAQDARPVTEYEGIIKASAINGAAVRNLQDEELGSVEDTILDPRSGEISYVVLSVGGFLGVGQRLVAVPWDELRVAEDGEGQSYYVVDASKSYLEQRPGLDEQNLPKELSEEWQPKEKQERSQE